MIADGSHPLPDSVPADSVPAERDALDVFADLDASSDLSDLGSVHFDPVTDIDGDGVGEVTSLDTDDGLVVIGDHDHDGTAERLTVIDRAGHFATWEFCTAEDGSTRWEPGKRGTVPGI